MTKYINILTLVFLASCGQTNNNTDKNEVVNSDSVSTNIENISVGNFELTDKTVKFLWRADRYDESLKATTNSIFIDEDFCKTITDPDGAALGYVATFIGNECWWDGEAKEDRSNLKCKILTVLNLGYQCSDRHLGFLRKWFRNDKKSLEVLKNCPTIPYTSTIQDTFDEITLNVKGNKILVSFKANGINMSEQKSWSWSETNHFEIYNDNIKMIKKDKSEVKHTHTLK